MVDAVDPRKFLVKDCAVKGASGAQAERSSFFEALGKVGDLEALNSVNSDIGQGLRSLESVANQIRQGEGVPQIFRDATVSIDNGADAVLETVGFDPNQVRNVVSGFSPQVTNRAVGQARAIYERVRQGNFQIRDIPEAVQDFRNLSQLVKGIFVPRGGSANSNTVVCEPSPFARDLIAYAPKHKFMFVVEFVFTQPHQAEYAELNFAFVIKRTTRPTISFDYDEVNFYNYRSKVLKRMEYEQMSMTFYDDMQDNALAFYNNYLRAISPVSRIETVGNGKNKLFEEAGMVFDDGINSAGTRNVDRGNPAIKNIIDYVQLFHIAEGGKYVDVYRFDDPKILRLNLDELDMTDTGQGTEVSIDFSYGAMALQPRVPIQNLATTITGLTQGGIYPLQPKIDGDVNPKDPDFVPADRTSSVNFGFDTPPSFDTDVDIPFATSPTLSA